MARIRFSVGEHVVDKDVYVGVVKGYDETNEKVIVCQ